MNDINKRVKQYRKILGFSQANIAEMLGKKPSTYAQLERCGTFSCDTIIKLAEIFKINVSVLLYGPVEPYKSEFTLTPKEINIIKIIRYLPSKTRNEILNFIDIKFKESKN